MNRREFLKQALKASLATTAAGALPLLPLQPARAQTASRLAVREGQDVPALVRRTLEALGGLGPVVKTGDTVVIKPNIGWDRPVETGANTHPLVVRTLAEMCLEAGAAKVRIFDRTCNDPRRCYVRSGIQEAVESLGSDRVTLEHIDPRDFQEVAIQKGAVLDRWPIYRPVLEADRLINVPVAKHHSISTLTLAMKNIMGVIGGNRGKLHQKIAESLADLNAVVPSDLVVVDATRILVANGPQGGRLEDVRQTHTLIASTDILAADSYAATLFDYRPEQIPTIVEGHRRGLGTMDLEKVIRV